jgi:hypothetical protein
VRRDGGNAASSSSRTATPGEAPARGQKRKRRAFQNRDGVLVEDESHSDEDGQASGPDNEEEEGDVDEPPPPEDPQAETLGDLGVDDVCPEAIVPEEEEDTDDPNPDHMFPGTDVDELREANEIFDENETRMRDYMNTMDDWIRHNPSSKTEFISGGNTEAPAPTPTGAGSSSSSTGGAADVSMEDDEGGAEEDPGSGGLGDELLERDEPPGEDENDDEGLGEDSDSGGESSSDEESDTESSGGGGGADGDGGEEGGSGAEDEGDLSDDEIPSLRAGFMKARSGSTIHIVVSECAGNDIPVFGVLAHNRGKHYQIRCNNWRMRRHGGEFLTRVGTLVPPLAGCKDCIRSV